MEENHLAPKPLWLLNNVDSPINIYKYYCFVAVLMGMTRNKNSIEENL